jgi:3-oxoacyl-[acyl-carrier protein] reductase
MSTAAARHPVAIVTGASRGIGRTVAHGLARDGYLVALVARDRAALDRVADEIVTIGASRPVISPMTFAIDVSDGPASERVVKSIEASAGRIDLLFNNAGIVRRGTSTLVPSHLHEMFETNIVGPFNFVRAVAPSMMRCRAGHIVNVSSRSGIFPKPQNGGYAATKAALRGYSAALFQELAAHGIKVTTIFPSYVLTGQSGGQKWLPDIEKIQPEDIYATVRFLLGLSPSASIKEVVIECTYVVANGEQYV